MNLELPENDMEFIDPNQLFESNKRMNYCSSDFISKD
jgi:hypothetical protein